MNLDINDEFFIQLYGRPNSGKTHLIRYLVASMAKEKNKFDHVILFCKTAELTDDYSFLPDCYKFREYSDDVLLEYLKVQSRAIKDPNIKVKPRGLVILDDIIGKSQKLETDLLIEFTTQYRHFNVNIILSSQYINKVPPQIREAGNHIFLFRQHTDNSKEAAYLSFAGSHFDNKKSFFSFMRKTTGNYRFLYVDLTSQSTEVNDVFKSLICPAEKLSFRLEY